jgi:hypothetical protein
VVGRNEVANPVLRASLEGDLFQPPPSWTLGRFIYRMPWKYRLRQAPANEFPIQTVLREMQMDGPESPHGAGTVHITQQGACVSRQVSGDHVPCISD